VLELAKGLAVGGKAIARRCALLAQIAAVLSPVRFGGKADIG